MKIVKLQRSASGNFINGNMQCLSRAKLLLPICSLPGLFFQKINAKEDQQQFKCLHTQGKNKKMLTFPCI